MHISYQQINVSRNASDILKTRRLKGRERPTRQQIRTCIIVFLSSEILKSGVSMPERKRMICPRNKISSQDIPGTKSTYTAQKIPSKHQLIQPPIAKVTQTAITNPNNYGKPQPEHPASRLQSLPQTWHKMSISVVHKRGGLPGTGCPSLILPNNVLNRHSVAAPSTIIVRKYFLIRQDYPENCTVNEDAGSQY